MDIIPGVPQGKALDILQSGPLLGFSNSIIGTNSYQETTNSDIAVITAGVTRKPGMSRDDLLLANMEIVKGVTNNIVNYSPDSIIIMVTNPLDAMAQLAFRLSRFPRNRVIGMSGVLDTARFKAFIAMELNISVRDIQALVLGGHGDTMVPIPRLTTVSGIPIAEFLPEERINSIVDRTIKAGDEVLSKTGISAYYAPSAAIARMVDAIVLNENKILPCSAYLEGEYGINGVLVGVPVKLGRSGIEDIIEVKLTPQESEALMRSAEAVRELDGIMKLD